MDECQQLANCQSITDVLTFLLPSEDSDCIVDPASELILWADRFGRKRDSIVIPAEAWPRLDCTPMPWPQQLAQRRQRRRVRNSRSTQNVWRRKATHQSHWDEHAYEEANGRESDEVWTSRWLAHPDLYPMFLEWLHDTTLM